MLTADLLDFRRRQGRVVPRLLDPAAPALVAAAEALTTRVQEHVGRSRGDLDEALRGAEFPGVMPKTVLALVRLLMERCTFDVSAAADPVVVRAAVFDAAAEARRKGPVPVDGAAAAPGADASWRSSILRRAGAELGLDVPAVEAALYADLEHHQRLVAVEPIRPQDLLWRHNTAQVQGLLLRAEQLEITAPWPDVRRLRQLLRYLKFFGLLFRQADVRPAPPGGRGRAVPEGLRLIVDGPLSVLESGTRYGLQLAQFLPALLLWEGPWRLEADVQPGKRRTTARLVVEPHPWLCSHYPDHGQWVGEDVLRFVDAFNGGKGPWRAEPAEALRMLADNRFLVPDFVFRRPGAAPVELEHLPYPDAALVRTRLEQSARTHGDYLLAARGVPSLRPLAGEFPQLVLYRRSLIPGVVREALERLRPA